MEPKLAELGYRMLAISPEPPEKLVETMEKNSLTYTLLSDADLVAIRGFGIGFQAEANSPLPVPSVYIVGMNGMIRFQYVNPDYRVRIDPDLLMAAAKAEQE